MEEDDLLFARVKLVDGTIGSIAHVFAIGEAYFFEYIVSPNVWAHRIITRDDIAEVISRCTFK